MGQTQVVPRSPLCTTAIESQKYHSTKCGSTFVLGTHLSRMKPHPPPLPLYKKRPCILSAGGRGEGTVTFALPNLQKSSILSFSRVFVGWTK